MSSSSLSSLPHLSSSLSPAPPSSPPPISSYNTNTEFLDQRLRSALSLVGKKGSSEAEVTRYTIILLQKYFSYNVWNLVAQYYTQNRKFPDLVLENFIRRPERKRDKIFVPKVFIELKTEVNSQDAIKQLINSISNEFGEKFNSKGFLIGVKGTQWTIMDYHLVTAQNMQNPKCLIRNFYDDREGDTIQPERPRPSKQYKDYEFMDLKLSDDSSNLFKALDWIGKENQAKDLTFMQRHAKHLPVSLTRSTMESLDDSSEIEIEEAEVIEGLQDEFAHLIPMLRGNFVEITDAMDTDD